MVDSGVGVADHKDVAHRAVLTVAVAVAGGHVGGAVLNTRVGGGKTVEAREARSWRCAGCAWAGAGLGALEVAAEDVAVLASSAAKRGAAHAVGRAHGASSSRVSVISLEASEAGGEVGVAADTASGLARHAASADQHCTIVAKRAGGGIRC